MHVLTTTLARLRRPIIGLLLVLALLLPGCTFKIASPFEIPASVFGDLGGWNLSACGGGGFQTCASLFLDNDVLLLDGRTTQQVVNEATVSFLTALNEIKVRVGG